MKKCPFCAEEIQDEAIKCRYCQSFLSAAPSKDKNSSDEPAEAPEPRPAVDLLRPEVGSSSAKPRAKTGGDDDVYERKVLYAGSPSWRAFFREYAIISILIVLVPLFLYWMLGKFDAGSFTLLLGVAIPLVGGALALFALHIYRTSKIFRITTTNIESEYGVLSKKIDVLELWRCRDVRYQQSLFDRILGIAHIEIFTADVTTPQLCLEGLPASRQLFEKIRDSIEIQRQARNVVGFVQ